MMSLLVKQILGLSLQLKKTEKEQIQLPVDQQETFLAEGRALNIIVISDQQHQDLEP